MADFITNRYFVAKLKHIDIKVTSNKTKHLESERRLTDLSKIFFKYQEKDKNLEGR